MAIQPIDTSTNTDITWYSDTERAEAVVLNRPSKALATVVNQLINLYLDPTESTGLNTGAIQMAGGLAVAKNVNLGGILTEISDISKKENVEDISNALSIILQLRGVRYNKIGGSLTEIGFIAQEVDKIVPEIVQTDEDGIKSLSYARTVALIVEAVKEQQTNHKADFDNLKTMVEELQTEINILKKAKI